MSHEAPTTRLAPRPILFVTKAPARRTSELLRAVALSHALRTHLCALVVAEPSSATGSMLFPQRVTRRRLSDLDRDVVSDETATWIARVGDPSAVHVAEGTLTAAIREHVARHPAAWIVVPASDLDDATDAAFLARELGTPVLLAQPPTRTGRDARVLAATSLRDDAYPVLRAASHLADSLDVPLVAFHNTPTEPLRPLLAPHLHVVTSTSADVLAARCSLDDALGETSASEARLAQHPSTIDAIVDAAEALQPTVLALGVPRSSWVDRALFGDIATDVLDRARVDVLLVPYD